MFGESSRPATQSAETKVTISTFTTCPPFDKPVLSIAEGLRVNGKRGSLSAITVRAEPVEA